MCFISLVFLLIANLPGVISQDEGDNEEVSKAFITLGILCAALVISLIVAKIVDWCYDRSTLRDDASDISEHTRKLIRARLAVMKFSKKELAKPVTNAQRVSRVIRIWSAKSKRQSLINRNADDTGQKDSKHPLKVAFIDVPDEKASNIDKERFDRISPVTLQVPIETDVMILESADGVSDSNPQNPSELIITVPSPPPKNPNKSTNTDSQELTVVPVLTKVTPDKNVTAIPDTKSTNKVTPKNQNNSSTPAATPRSSKPFNKSKSVPYMNSRVGPQLESQTQDYSPNFFRSPSPPKILIKQPTDADFVPKLKTTSSKKTVFEKENRNTKVITTQPTSKRTMSAKSIRSTDQRGHLSPTRSAPSQRQFSYSTDGSDLLGKKAVHFKHSEGKKSPAKDKLKT